VPVKPMMAFSGVRSSWLMPARKWSLARLALASSWFFSCSAFSKRLRSLMSRMALMTKALSSVRSGLRLISIGNSLPSRRRPARSSPEPIARLRGCRK
jgi:hypothetical protein